jgi:hypothetical protein
MRGEAETDSRRRIATWTLYSIRNACSIPSIIGNAGPMEGELSNSIDP